MGVKMGVKYAIQYYTDAYKGMPRRAFQVFSAEGKYLGTVIARSDRDDVMDTLHNSHPTAICIAKIYVSVKTYKEAINRLV